MSKVRPAARQAKITFFAWLRTLSGSRQAQLINSLLWRLPLGLVFIYAALEKIIDPAAFAVTIDNYRLFPAFAIGPMAIVLPWLEMWAGGLVVLGIWKRPAALILGVLLVGFILAVGFNLYRGLDFECGCFGSGSRRAGINLLWQDGLLLICAVTLIRRKPKSNSDFIMTRRDAD